MRQELKELVDKNAKRYLSESMMGRVVNAKVFVEEARKEIPDVTDDELREAIPYVLEAAGD